MRETRTLSGAFRADKKIYLNSIAPSLFLVGFGKACSRHLQKRLLDYASHTSDNVNVAKEWTNSLTLTRSQLQRSISWPSSRTATTPLKPPTVVALLQLLPHASSSRSPTSTAPLSPAAELSRGQKEVDRTNFNRVAVGIGVKDHCHVDRIRYLRTERRLGQRDWKVFIFNFLLMLMKMMLRI